MNFNPQIPDRNVSTVLFGGFLELVDALVKQDRAWIGARAAQPTLELSPLIPVETWP